MKLRMWLTAGCGVALAAFLLATGVAPTSALLLPLFVLWQSVAGAALWRRLRPSSSVLEEAGMGLALGTAVAALAGLLTSTMGLGPWGWAVPSAVALVVVAVTRHHQIERQAAPPHGVDRPVLAGLAAALVIGLAVLVYSLRSYPLTWVGSWTDYHPDMPYFEALSTSLARFGALDSPFMTGGVVRYHWLSYAWAGQLTESAGAAPFVTITRVLPFVALLGCALVVVSWTRRLTPHSWTPTLAALLLTLGGFTGAVFGGVLTMDSPSQSLSVLWLLAFCLLAVLSTKEDAPLGAMSVALFLLAIALVGGKVSAAAPAMAGILLMALVQATRRQNRPLRVWLPCAAAYAGGATGFLIFLAGSNGGGGLTLGSLVDKAASQQGLNPTDSRFAVVAGTAILILAVLPRWAGVLWLGTRQQWRWRPEVTLSLGMAASSILALLAFNSFNEIWFSSTVSGPLAAVSAAGAGVALDSVATRPRPTARHLLLVSVAGALIAYGMVWALWATGASGGNTWTPTLRWLGPLAAWIGAAIIGLILSRYGTGRWVWTATVAGAALALVLISVPGRVLGVGTGMVGKLDNGLRKDWFSVFVSKYPKGLDESHIEDWTSTRMEAAAWLRANSSPADIVATNVTRDPFVAGVTHLRTFASGLEYQIPYGTPALQEPLLDRERAAWAFIDHPSATTIAPLCAAGVSWLWIDPSKTLARSWAPIADVVIDKEDVVVASINREACQ